MPSSLQVANVLDFLPASEHAAIRAGHSTYDCTSGIQAAIAAAGKVFVAAGVYPVKQLNLKSGIELYGEGHASELKAYDQSLACEFMLATHVRDGGSSSVSDNMRNIHLHDLKLNGRVAEFGYEQYFYLLAVNATSDLTVERVAFYGFRGDGMYVGSGTLASTERHNQRVAVRDCMFDGAVKDNRNGLSVIDCDQLTVENCVFRNIGNAKLSHSVGAIDFEPDHNWSVYRQVTIAHCQFIDIDSVNTAGITFFNGHQAGDNIHDWVVSDCQFTNCYWGIDSSTKAKTPADRPDNLSVLNCHFLNSIRVDVGVKGLSGTQISGCTFERSPAGSGPGGDAIRLGAVAFQTTRNAINTVITGNTFTGIRPQMGAVGVLGANGLVCAGNVFIDIRGTCINFAEDATPDRARDIDRVIISGNVVRLGTHSTPKASSMSFLSTSNQMRISMGHPAFEHSFEYANDIENGVTKVANGAAIQFRGVGQPQS
ncbi:right-handed parallel beta-helix repeat-containing protein [Rhodanobacter denitrificans]|uniref:Right-handed parallel beta-helix repeat-containing protein n=1 Tax=Rhodanobacter denitrificans TaxID=666685 RepID=A0A368KHI9_9GAMM|nr:glycosyl hydrolase family 28-related protein [Rhodanobacter denitrificans]RCS30628.1 right-handed parallel beta-helix repeat-containing protein [Rhodanobacter denitrificans]